MGILGARTADAAMYYVAKTGSNSNSGTSTLSPWLTIQYAAVNAPTGSDICVIPGADYEEKVLITRSDLHFTGQCAGVAGTTVNPTSVSGSGSYHPAFEILDASDITIEHFRISNAHDGVALTAGPINIGILVTNSPSGPAMSDIEIADNYFTGVNSPELGIDRGALGIFVLGYRLGSSYAISQVQVTGNVFYNNTMSSDWNSNAIALSGNVTDSLVAANTLSNFGVPGPNPAGGVTGTIGIQAAVNPAHTPSDPTDHARRIVIRDNTIVKDINVPASGTWGDIHALANVGANQILIERNYVRDARIAINVASETPDDDTGQTWIRDNVIAGSTSGDLSIGDPTFGSSSTHADCYRPVEDIFVTNNTFYSDSGIATFRIQLRAGTLGESAFRNNIVSAYWKLLLFDAYGVPTPGSGPCSGLTPPAFPNDTELDYNTWHVQPDVDLVIAFAYLDTWGTWLNWDDYYAAASPLDANSDPDDPDLDDPTTIAGFTIDSGSSARDTGDYLAPSWGDTVGDFGTYDAAETDFYGNLRIVNSVVDRGAAEYQP